MDSLNITKILADDLEARSNVEMREKDIYSLEDLSDKKWDFNSPTMILYPSFLDTAICDFIITDTNEVVRKFLEIYPILEGVDMSNFLIAGGSICNIIVGFSIITDIDIFVYGLDLEEVPERMNKFIRDLDLDRRKGKIIKTKFATTITIEHRLEENVEEDVGPLELTIQIIHRLYDSPSQVLHGFDIGSCSVGLIMVNGSKDASEGSKVITTGLGRIALEYKINIWDPLKRGIAYEYRLAKYFKRGFNIVFPNLSIEKVKLATKKGNDVSFKKILFSTYRVVNNKIFCKEVGKCLYFSDYYSPTDNMNSNSNVKTNIFKLTKGEELVYYKRWQDKNELLSFLHDNVIIYPSKEDIEVFFSTLLFYYSGSINIRKLKLYLPETYKDVIMRYLEVEEPNKVNEEVRVMCIERLNSLLEVYMENGGYVRRWRILNPGSQVDGTFQPEQISIKEFYGDLLRE